MTRNFAGKANGSIEGTMPWDTLQPDEMQAFVKNNPQLKFVTSHQARLPCLPVEGTQIHPVFFIRHPIDRVESVYMFERRQAEDSKSPSVAIARQHGLAGFVEWILSSESTVVARDFQVAHLAAVDRDMRVARATLEQLDISIQRIHEAPFVGLVDRFHESMQVLSHYLRPFFGNLDFTYSIENRSEGRAATLDERLARIEQSIGKTLYDQLLDCNALDMALYDVAAARADADIRRIAELEGTVTQ
ncbi:hypothetical protein [Burkholderia stagnalis]|nr:hypothetical protein WT28_17540 [Burkholderia stagnalis]